MLGRVLAFNAGDMAGFEGWLYGLGSKRPMANNKIDADADAPSPKLSRYEVISDSSDTFPCDRMDSAISIRTRDNRDHIFEDDINTPNAVVESNIRLVPACSDTCDSFRSRISV